MLVSGIADVPVAQHGGQNDAPEVMSLLGVNFMLKWKKIATLPKVIAAFSQHQLPPNHPKAFKARDQKADATSAMEEVALHFSSLEVNSCLELP